MARILIVEDEEKIARFVTLELEHEGYQVEHAADGRTAVDLALERDYDLILLDVLLPQLNGMEVLRRIRRELHVALDPDRREVTVGGSPIVLTAREFDVLALLMAHAETVLTRERIAHEALGYDYMGDTNNVDVHIAHLRAKIEDAGGARIIQTVRGVGYVCRA